MIGWMIAAQSSFKLNNGLLTTLGFMQVGLDLVTSANCKSQLQFQQISMD